jgi:hypothetical protein
VEKVNPNLVADGKVMTVGYEAVNAMLLNEFLKEHRKVQEQHATIACVKNEFESKFAQQQKQIERVSGIGSDAAVIGRAYRSGIFYIQRHAAISPRQITRHLSKADLSKTGP